MKMRNQIRAESPAGKRILCRICLIVVTGVFLLYMLGGARVFPALRPSSCERLFTEEQQVQACGRVYKKAVKGNTYALYLERIRVKSDEISREDAHSRCLDWEMADEENLLVYLSENDINLPDETGGAVPEIGQEIIVCGTISFYQEAPNPGNFNQKFYYQKQNIHAALRETEILQIVKDEGKEEGGRTWTSRLRERLWQIRLDVSDMIREYMGEARGGMLCSMMLGETAFADAEIKEIYQKSGIGHLLAISGLHISFMGMGLYRILRKAGVPVNAAAVSGSIVLCCYVILSGESVSAVRACVMFLIRMGAVATGREYDGLTALSVAAMAVLRRNPLQLFDAGFLLSFGAVLGIYAVKPLLWKKEEKSGMKETLRMSAAMQMTVLPVLLYYYYEVCVYSWAWNLIAVPLAGVILAAGLAGVMLEGMAWCLMRSVFESVSGPLIQLAVFLGKKGFSLAGAGLALYEAGSNAVLSFPVARWVAGQPGWGQIVIYYLAAAGIIIMRWQKQNEEQSKRQDGRRRFAKMLCLGIAAAAILYPHGKRGQLEIVMLNIGQGDCFFLRGPDGTTGLIDGGSSSVDQVGRYRLEPFLKSQGVGSLDYVWVSHGDIDHISGIEELFKRRRVGVKIRHLVLPPEEFWEEKLLNLASLAWEQGIPVFTMGQGQIFQAGGMTLMCIAPGGTDDETVESPGNEASMALSLSYGEFDMLFTGDLEKDGEEAAVKWMAEAQERGELPESYEILKVGHHGSRNATGEELLEIVRPACAWISAGEGNRYGHPHKEVLERLANWGVRLYNTKDGNAVKLCTDGKKYCILIP